MAEEAEFPAVTVKRPNPRETGWGQDVADEVVRRTAAGESLHAVCRAEGMPSLTAVGRWLRERPKFREAMLAARTQACAPLRGRRPIWCVETAEAILERVANGEALVAICEDPAMPSHGTVHRWKNTNAEFGAALREAMEIRAERMAEAGWALALKLASDGWGQGVEPGRAYACDVMLRQLRWKVSQLAPAKYGPKKAVEVEMPPKRQTVVIKTFKIGLNAQGERTIYSVAPNPETGRVERVDEGNWPGEEAPCLSWPASSAAPPDPSRPGAGTSADDPEGWG